MHFGRRVVMATVIGGLMLTAPKLAAQGDEDPLGFWFGLGLGPGWQLDEPPAGLTSFGAAWYLRLGGTPARWLRLGGEAIIWGTTSEGIARGNGNAMFIAQVYPVRTLGLFFKGGFGVAGAIIEGSVSGTNTETGFGTGLGAGYEFKMGGSLLIGVGADLMVQVIDFGGGTTTSPYVLFTVGIGTR